MDSIGIRLVGVDITANGVVAIVSITIVLLTFLVLYRPPSALCSSIFERLWHWYEKHRTNKIPRIRDNQTTLSPAEPQMPLWDDAAPEKSTARTMGKGRNGSKIRREIHRFETRNMRKTTHQSGGKK